MDGFREHPNEFDATERVETTAADDVAAAIGTDERRMHVRAYNHWVSLLAGRDFPSIEDLEPGEVSDFAEHSVLLDFTCGRENPAMPYIGNAIREECGLEDDMRTTAEVPSRSLLSRLTDHYMQIIANRAPIGFEAEFLNQRGENICYRGILMPFSSDGDTIDFIYGVINWKTVGASAEEDAGGVFELTEEMSRSSEEGAGAGAAHDEPSEADGAFAEEEPLELSQAIDVAEPAVHFSWEDGPLADESLDTAPVPVLEEDAGLADRLWAARETAEAAKAGEGRTRAALYRALSLAYDFAIAANANPSDYVELLEESGVKAQARAPMTPIVKLVFGIDYDKARLTEFAAALSFAQRQGVAAGDFQNLIEKQAGGLKALVAAERQARRPETTVDNRGEAARAKLRAARALSMADLPSAEEFTVVVMRRNAGGGHEPVAVIGDEALVERVIRRAA